MRSARCILIFLGCLLAARTGAAQEIVLREGQTEPAAGTMVVPFAFYNESLGLAAGGSVGNRGWIQPQAAYFLTVVGSVEGTAYGFLALRDIEVPWTDRLFVDAQFNLRTFSEIDIYADGNPAFPDAPAGTHDSDADNFIQGDGTDSAAWLRLLYVLPLGSGRDSPISTVVLRNGLAVEGARDTSTWNPLRGGYTLVGVRPFFRKQDVTTEEVGDFESATAGAEFGVHYHNTDFAVNPSRGGFVDARYAKDWGEFGSTAPWETLSLQINGYVPLGAGSRSRQRVLALSAWFADTPSWDDFDVKAERRVYHRPPAYEGASLGGMDRMRGYPEGRFNDRSAAYYAVEYRHIPEWNPFRNAAWLHRFNARVDWLQVVAGMEFGRVAGEFDLGDLHRDMNVCGVLGLRAMANHLVVRADIGISDEGAAVQMTIDHPF
ncbi:MAG: BamA/TamA family outer membrane protein [Phycisphaerae bacterium]|nr:BamA/TamA family outer membrane protein [Phycisphaerae bacterium]